MIFTKPTTFTEALADRRARALLPVGAEVGAAQLERLGPELLRRATFSARTSSARHLGRIDNIITRILDPAGAAPGESISEPRARELIRKSLASIGYDPADIDAVPGSIKDLASERRIHLILETNVKMARYHGQWQQGQTDAILDQWPCQELIRVESRVERRNWLETWRGHGGRVYSGVGLDGKPGRMIARKDDGIWVAISRFGNPYPPFDYSSGVGVTDVDRDESVRLGVIAEQDKVSPEPRDFNQDLQATPPADPQTQPTLFAAILQALGNQVLFQGGILRMQP